MLFEFRVQKYNFFMIERGLEKNFFEKKGELKFFVFLQPHSGRVAEQSGTGLQNLLKRCDSARDLNKTCCMSMQ